MKTKLRNVKPLNPKTFQDPKKPKELERHALPPLAEDYDILELDRPDDLELPQDSTNELTEQETRLITMYLDKPDTPKYQLAAMAGYQSSSQKTLVRIFNRVVAKWERGVHRLDIFRKAGLGELRVALRMRQLMLQNQNLGVAKDMAVHVSKIMDLVNPALDLSDGFEIRVTRAAEPAKPTPTGPDRAKLRVADKKARVTE
jgi:hypothetical protein